MKTTRKQFKLFKMECQKWARVFELSGWRMDFLFEDLGRHQANVDRNYENCVVTIRFSTIIEHADGRTFNDVIKNTAKHEMIHVLIGNLATLAYSKYVSESELTKAEEELTRKLETLIK